MGRTLSNTMMNLGVQATVDEALYQVQSKKLFAMMLDGEKSVNGCLKKYVCFAQTND